MRMMKPVMLAAWLAFAPAALAADAERMDAARAYVETPTVQQMMDGMFSPQAVNSMLTSMVPVGQSTEEQREAASNIISEELGNVREEVMEILVAATAETFTLAEIRALTDFYGSQEGQSIAAKMQPFMGQYLQKIGPVIQRMQNDIARRVKDELGQ